jgi:hypothetical protein
MTTSSLSCPAKSSKSHHSSDIPAIIHPFLNFDLLASSISPLILYPNLPSLLRSPPLSLALPLLLFLRFYTPDFR